MASVRAALAGVCVAALVYLVGSFMAWDINPGHWDASGRGLCGSFMALGFGVAFALKMAFAECQ